MTFPRARLFGILAQIVLVALLPGAAGALAQFTVTPVDVIGADGKPDAVDVDSRYYKFRFILWEAGSADSMIYKPLNHELRAENYYGNHTTIFRDWARLADPDPITGYTRDIGNFETRTQSRQPATYRIVRQDKDELVIEFETRCSTEGGQPWMEKILNRRRLFIRNDTPAIRVENEIANTDTEARSVLFDLFNSVSFGRVSTWVSMPGVEGKVGGLDIAEERASQFIFAPEVAGDWIGGVNEQGLGAGFSCDWSDVDAMHVCMWKTVGSSYHVCMRRREIPAGQAIAFKYTFMPLTGFGAFDGMRNDLAGGFLVGQKASFKEDVSTAELKAGATLPIKVFLAGGSDRQVRVRLHCVRQEDKQVVLDKTESLALKVAATQTLDSEVKLPQDGLYVITITADDGAGTQLRMEKPLEVGKTKLAYAATPPIGEKRGKRDGGETLGPGMPDSQFTTLDLNVITPHLPLLKNHANGPVRAFFLTPADSTLGHVREICERSDIVPEHYAVGKISTPPEELNPRGLGEFRKQFRTSDAEVLVTLGINWNIGLKAKLANEILTRIREGMGAVVMVRDLAKQLELADALAEGREIKSDSVLPAAATMVPQIRRFELGKGRIALILCNWAPSRDEGRTALGNWTELRVGQKNIPIPELKWRGFEYSYAYLADLIRWAAKKESAIAITGATAEGNAATINVHNDGQSVIGRLGVVLRTRRWEDRGRGIARTEIPTGESRQEVKLTDAPDGGPFALEIQLRDDPDKRVLAFASVGAKADEPVTMKVLPQPAYQSAEKPGTCAVEIAGKIPQGRLDVTVTDRFDRVVLRRSENVAMGGGKTRVEFRLDTFKPLCVYHEIVAGFYAFDGSDKSKVSDHLLAEASADLYLLPAKPPYADRFTPGVWGAPERDALQMQGMYDTIRRLGFVMHSHSYGDPLLYSSGGYKAALNNLSVHSRYAKRGEKVALDSEKLIMEPPLLPSEDAVKAAKEAWQASARKEFETGARMLGLDDERRMSDDFDFHPQTLTGFRKWLKGRHATIADLNKTWGTNFSDFSSVVPKRRKELGDSANLAPWLEFRMFIGDVLGEYYMKRPAEWAAEINPNLSVCEWGIYEPSATWPVDWSKYAKSYKFTSRYGDNQGVLEELFRCFAPETRHGAWMGYGMLQISPERRIAPWQSLLNGGNFCWFWELRDPGSLNYAVLTSDQRPTAGYAALGKDEFPDLTGGIDRLILAGQFTDDGIAIAYSYPSWLADSNALARESKLIVEELGYQHRFVNMDDAAKGQLEKENFRLLIIHQATCLSVEQGDAVRRFVEKGGVLLCLGRTGWRDLHGAPHPNGSLMDALTGVETDSATPLGRIMQSNDPKSPLWLSVQHKDVVAKNAQVLAAADLDGKTLPVLTARDLGKGKVFWLNSTLQEHRRVSRSGAADERSMAGGGPEAIRQSHWAVFDRVVGAAAIKSRCRVLEKDKPIFDTETWYYETPSRRSLFVAHYLSRHNENPVAVRFDRTGHIYELRSGRYFGSTDAIQDTFPPGHMRVYAILDYAVKSVKATLDAKSYKPGDTINLSCAIQTDGNPADLHALRITVSGPNSKDLPACKSVLLAPEGKANVVLSLALNQPIGKHAVTVTDVVSGARTQQEFEVTQK